MSVGMILLVLVAVLTLFGISQRVLDGMRLNDRSALLVVGAMFIGGLIPNIPLGSRVSINIGGAIIPVALCVYLFIKADTAKEKIRTLIAVAVTAAGVYAVGRLFPNEPDTMPFDVNYLYGIIGGVIAYILGRSRRGAFIAGIMGVLLADVINAVVLAFQGVSYSLNLGGGGYFDITVISGLLAVILAEVVGEIVERIVRGRENKGNREEGKNNA